MSLLKLVVGERSVTDENKKGDTVLANGEVESDDLTGRTTVKKGEVGSDDTNVARNDMGRVPGSFPADEKE